MRYRSLLERGYSGFSPMRQCFAALEIDHHDFRARGRLEMEGEPVAIKGDRGDGRILGDRQSASMPAGRAPTPVVLCPPLEA